MEVIGEFSSSIIYQEEETENVEEEEEEIEDELHWKDSIVDHKIVQLKGNVIPKGLVPLERFLNENDVHFNVSKNNWEDEVEDCNIGTNQWPKLINLENDISKEYKHMYVDLFKKYFDISSWCYRDIKTYTRDIIQHKTPLKSKTKPYKKKFR